MTKPVFAPLLVGGLSQTTGCIVSTGDDEDATAGEEPADAIDVLRALGESGMGPVRRSHAGAIRFESDLQGS